LAAAHRSTGNLWTWHTLDGRVASQVALTRGPAAGEGQHDVAGVAGQVVEQTGDARQACAEHVSGRTGSRNSAGGGRRADGHRPAPGRSRWPGRASTSARRG